VLLKLYHRFRVDQSAYREFVERDDSLNVDRRLAVCRDLGFSEREIEIVLQESSDQGIQLIKDQLVAADASTGLGDVLTRLPAAALDHKKVVDAVEQDIRRWLKAVGATSWPGVKGPFIEHVSPACVESDLMTQMELQVDVVIDGWLVNPNKTNNGEFQFKLLLYEMGTKTERGKITVVSVDDTKYPRSKVKATVMFDELHDGAKIANFDVVISQIADKDHKQYPEGTSRVPAAITACKFDTPYP
jgi:hypothetical protein